MFTLDDVDVAFDKIVQLKYSQTVHLKGTHLSHYRYVLIQSCISCTNNYSLRFVAFRNKSNIREEFISQYMYFCLIGKGHGIQITPLPAGHMLGGTIWKIIKDGEEEIVYAVDYNHKKER